jgi:hypothetical protein
VEINYSFPASTTGNVTFTPGFPPKRISVYAANPSSTAGMQYVGSIVWADSSTNGAYSDGIASTFVSGTGQYVYKASQAIALVGAAGGLQFAADFVSWNPTGFTLNVTAATSACNATFLCHAK